MPDTLICYNTDCNNITRGLICAKCIKKLETEELRKRPIPLNFNNPTERTPEEAERIAKLIKKLKSMTPEEQMRYCLGKTNRYYSADSKAETPSLY